MILKAEHLIIRAASRKILNFDTILHEDLNIYLRLRNWICITLKEWVSFFLGSWEMNRSAEQTNRVNREAVLVRFVVPHCDSFPMNREKKTLIPYIYNASNKDSF